MSRPSLVSLANRHVRIEQACRWADMDVPDIDTGTSLKTWCPFGELYHPDSGAEAAMRLYPESNTAWCFACSERFTPVRICAVTWHQPYREVALELLNRVGYKPVDFAHLWQEVTAPDPDLGLAEAAQALRHYAAGLPGWDQLQYDPQVAGNMSRCLGLLGSVRSAEEVEQWLDGCKWVIQLTCQARVARCGQS